MFTLTKRKNMSYKKDYGKVLVLAGNEKYGGAGILAARAALYSGAGLVTLATHTKNHCSLHAQQAEIMLRDWEEDLGDEIAASQVLLVGPGLGTSEKSKKILQRALWAVDSKTILILDASALRLFNKLELPSSKLILTPHLGEMRALSGLQNQEISDETCLSFSQEKNCFLVLKDHVTKLYYQGQVHKNIPGTPAMATGGSGDVLAGMIAGFSGQFETSLAIKASLYIHSKIALDLAEKNYLVLPSQIIERIPQEMKKLESPRV